MEHLLSVDRVSVEYAGSPTLREVCTSIDPGEIVGVVGESGSGKSTLIYAILGILSREGRITEGTITYEGKELGRLKGEELRRLRGSEISLLAQNPLTSFHPIRKVRAQLKDLVKSHPTMSYAQAEEEMLRIMERISLREGEHLLDSYAFEFSGGMAQRVSIAMAMVLQPKLLLADEPTSALDVTSQKQVVEEMLKIRDAYRTAILIVSHNMGVISHMADRILVMHNGMVVEQGSREQVIHHPMHLYTRNLIHAIPTMDGPVPKGVKSFPRVKHFQGCPYWEICSRKTEICGSQLPPDREVAPGHWVKCWNAGEEE